MPTATIGQLLINDILPEELRDYSRVWNKSNYTKVLQQVAEKYPDQYADILHKLTTVGADAAYTSGASLSIEDIKPSQAKKKAVEKINKQLIALEHSNIPDDVRDQKIVELLISHLDEVRNGTHEEGLAEGNNLAYQAESGARGNKAQVSSIRGADLVVMDHKDRPVPIPITHNYSEGLSPAEYFAASYGTRKGVVAVKTATAKSGYLGKQLGNAAGRLLVSDEDPLPDTGYPVETSDPDNEGAILARDYGAFTAGTVLTPSIIKALSKDNDEILIHSPISAGGRGVPRLAAGFREKGMAPVGDNIGFAAAQAIGERLSQSQLCLAKGTVVKMADGFTKKIEEIDVGDKVLGADKQGNVFPVKVVATYANGIKDCVHTDYRFISGDHVIKSLTCTKDHKILTADGLVIPVHNAMRIRALLPGDVYVIDSDASIMRQAGQYDAGRRHTYDIEVDHPDHLFVLANGLIVSNSAKHGAGVIGSSHETSVSGFEGINQLFNVPKSFQAAAAVAQTDGRIDKIEDAPQGGKYVTVNNTRHYVNPGFKISAKVGDAVEAGDVLSEGVPNPAEIVKYKGIGEGRRYFTNQLRSALKSQGVNIHRRNLEVMSRGLINHVRVTDLDGVEGYLPDDIVEYDDLASTYTPRVGALSVTPNRAVGKYLEKPALHYSIGTRVNKNVENMLRKHNIGQVMVHDDPPPFEPHMVRAIETTLYDKDFMRRLQGFYITKGFMDSAQRGGSSPIHGQNYAHSLAEAKDFGKDINKGIY